MFILLFIVSVFAGALTSAEISHGNHWHECVDDWHKAEEGCPGPTGECVPRSAFKDVDLLADEDEFNFDLPKGMLERQSESSSLESDVARIEKENPASRSMVSEALGASWSGKMSDPLWAMVNWGQQPRNDICYADLPPGWASWPYIAEVYNDSLLPGSISVGQGRSKSAVDVVKARYAGGERLPWTMVADNGDGYERASVLDPGETCFLLLPLFAGDTYGTGASRTGWTVYFQSYIRGGVELPIAKIGNSYLRLEPHTLSTEVKKRAYFRGKQMMRMEIGPNEGLPYPPRRRW